MTTKNILRTYKLHNIKEHHYSRYYTAGLLISDEPTNN